MEHLVSPPKRVLAIHDLSGFGRCSLTAITPVLSVMGVQVCPVPTAILSTHTGGLGDPVITDLTDSLLPALRHYQSLGLGLGLCLGTAFGAVFHNLAIGISVGLCLGLAIGTAIKKKDPPGPTPPPERGAEG